MQYTEHRYASADKRLELFARDYGGDGPPLLLMHGLTRNSADFEPLAEHLAHEFRLVVPDQRGRGLSEYDTEPDNYRPEIYAQDMFALLDDLGIERPGIIGTSMGGMIALAMNAVRPGTFPAIVFNDIGPELAPEGLARIGSYVGGAKSFVDWAEAARACAAVNEQAFPDFGETEWTNWAKRTCTALPDGDVVFAYDPEIARAFADLEHAPQPDLWPLWEMLGDTPALVVRGALSDLLTSETVAEMEARHAGSFESVTVPGRGHAPLLDEPEALSAITHFLETHCR